MSDSPGAAAPYIEIDGHRATADDLAIALMHVGGGHFTAMQVRAGRTRGLDFHFARLDAATREIFGAELGEARVRELLGHALSTRGAEPDASLRVNVYRPSGADIRVLVSLRPPAGPPAKALRLASVPYQRPFPHLKHGGGFAQGRYIDLVSKSGFDEPLLVDTDGVVAEGAITNVGVVEGDTVVWPDAPMLRGIAMQVLDRELARAGVPTLRRRITVADLAAADGVFLTNSRGAAPVERIDRHDVPTDAPSLKRVLDLFDAAPWDLI
jgi:branched-subunit amino acid aminotransferase/4-amino-4-deoxychorismate lyase